MVSRMRLPAVARQQDGGRFAGGEDGEHGDGEDRADAMDGRSGAHRPAVDAALTPVAGAPITDASIKELAPDARSEEEDREEAAVVRGDRARRVGDRRLRGR
jgi:hypothetical protein